MKKSYLHSKTPIHITVALVATVMLVLHTACQQEAKPEVVASIDSLELVPNLRTLDVNSIISDSGEVQARIIAKEWLIYDNAKEPYWLFPQGILVEKFDSLQAVEAYIESDTAIFLSDKQEWELRGNVKMKNLKQERFETEQIFWRQKDKSISSDRFIHIEQNDKIIEGYGFESNEEMTKYKIHRTQGIFPINRKAKQEEFAPSDTLTTTPKH